MNFQYNDGGRKASGAKGARDDCAVRAVAVATGLSYQAVCFSLQPYITRERTGSRKRGKSHPYHGVYRVTLARFLRDLGWTWVATMRIGSGCTVHLRAHELPPGRLIVSVSRHITAVIDSVIHDTHDPSRGGTRCVYGYWTKEPHLALRPDPDGLEDRLP